MHENKTLVPNEASDIQSPHLIPAIGGKARSSVIFILGG